MMQVICEMRHQASREAWCHGLASGPSKHLDVYFFALVAGVGQLADAVQFFVHLLVQERFRFRFQKLDNPGVNAVAVGLAAELRPVVPVRRSMKFGRQISCLNWV